MGFIHGVFFLVAILPVLPYMHPRLASEYNGQTENRLIEPPWIHGLELWLWDTGYRASVSALLGQTYYG